MVLGSGPDQRRLAIEVLACIDLGARLDEDVDRGRGTRASGAQQNRFTLGQRRIGIGAGLEKRFQRIGVAVDRGEMLRRHAVAVGGVRVRTRGEQRGDELAIA